MPTTEELRKQWGKAIQERRLAKQWSQSRLAEEVGLQKETIYRIERGQFAGSDETRMRIAHALGVEVHELYAYDTPSAEEAVS